MQPLSHVRAALRLLRLGGWIGWTLLARALLPLASSRSSRSQKRQRLTLSRAKRLCNILGVRLRVEGKPPRPPFWLVSNHVSYVDIPLLASLTGGVFVSKSEVRSWPMLGWVAAAYGTLFLERRNVRRLEDINKAITGVISRGDGLIFFPEGTSTNGKHVRHFHASLLAPAAAQDAPVHYACIHYQTPTDCPPAEEAVCWWGDMTLMGHLYRLMGLPYINARVDFGANPVFSSDRKALAETLHTKVSALLEPAQQIEAL